MAAIPLLTEVGGRVAYPWLDRVLLVEAPEAVQHARRMQRDGIDAAKALRLGADLVGQAAGVLVAATQSTEAVIEHFDMLLRQLRIVCFCTGSANLAHLRRARLLPASLELP